jgi:hypothetical protein
LTQLTRQRFTLSVWMCVPGDASKIKICCGVSYVARRRCRSRTREYAVLRCGCRHGDHVTHDIHSFRGNYIPACCSSCRSRYLHFSVSIITIPKRQTDLVTDGHAFSSWRPTTFSASAAAFSCRRVFGSTGRPTSFARRLWNRRSLVGFSLRGMRDDDDDDDEEARADSQDRE